MFRPGPEGLHSVARFRDAVLLRHPCLGRRAGLGDTRIGQQVAQRRRGAPGREAAAAQGSADAEPPQPACLIEVIEGDGTTSCGMPAASACATVPIPP